MEILRMFQDSYRSTVNVKKTFCWVGFENANKLRKPIKDMNKEEQFSCIMNWIMHEMPKRETAIIRFEALGQAYQAKIGHDGKRLYVNKPTLMPTITKPTLYDWEGEETYYALTTDKIRNSIQRADQMNHQREQELGQELMELFTSVE